MQLVPKKKVNPKRIQDGIEQLERRREIIIRPADKGGGVVILDKDFYYTQLNNMLLDQEAYVKLERDPTNKYNKELKKLWSLVQELGY